VTRVSWPAARDPGKRTGMVLPAKGPPLFL
jgi:hypothetical protein